MQTTLKRDITLVGMGLHSGRPARMVLRPATAGGIRFRRVDVTDRDNVIPARFDRVADTTLCTLIRNEAGVSLGTVEHLMAALAGTGVTHVARRHRRAGGADHGRQRAPLRAGDPAHRPPRAAGRRSSRSVC